jgi:hypothetical protein
MILLRIVVRLGRSRVSYHGVWCSWGDNNFMKGSYRSKDVCWQYSTDNVSSALQDYEAQLGDSRQAPFIHLRQRIEC